MKDEFWNARGEFCCSTTGDVATLCARHRVEALARARILAESSEQRSARLTRENESRGLRAAAEGAELRAAAALPEVACVDPYRSLSERAPVRLSLDDDESYQVYGSSNSYAPALKARAAAAQAAQSDASPLGDASPREPKVVNDERGTPDGYLTAIAAGRAS